MHLFRIFIYNQKLSVMKNYVLIVALLLLSLGCTQQNSEADKAGAEAAIKGFYGALEKLDFSALPSYCTPSFHSIEDGNMYNSIDDFINAIKSMGVSSVQIKMDFVKTEVDKDMALSIVKFDGSFETSNGKMNAKTIENYVLKKVQGKWLIDFYQSTYLSKAPKLEKGNILGIHVLKDIKLSPGVTMQQVEEFLLNKYIPAFNELAGDVKVFAFKSMRGESEGITAIAYYLNSVETLNKYWPSEGVQSEEAKALFQKIQDLQTEFYKMVTIKKDFYNDWQVE